MAALSKIHLFLCGLAIFILLSLGNLISENHIQFALCVGNQIFFNVSSPECTQIIYNSKTFNSLMSVDQENLALDDLISIYSMQVSYDTENLSAERSNQIFNVDQTINIFDDMTLTQEDLFLSNRMEKLGDPYFLSLSFPSYYEELKRIEKGEKKPVPLSLEMLDKANPKTELSLEQELSISLGLKQREEEFRRENAFLLPSPTIPNYSAILDSSFLSVSSLQQEDWIEVDSLWKNEE